MAPVDFGLSSVPCYIQCVSLENETGAGRHSYLPSGEWRGQLFSAEVPVLATLHPIWERGKREDDENTDSKGDHSFDEEEPPPWRPAGRRKRQIAVDSKGDQATKGARQGGGGEVNSSSGCHFVSLV